MMKSTDGTQIPLGKKGGQNYKQNGVGFGEALFERSSKIDFHLWNSFFWELTFGRNKLLAIFNDQLDPPALSFG
jgi:hypothetical protein